MISAARGIYLVGFMASGKSSVGSNLARNLAWDFVDLDAEIERIAGQSIADLVAGEGIEAFRAAESSALRSALGEPGVVALGGGTFLLRENRVSLMKSGVSVWLELPLATIRERVGDPGTRPVWPTDSRSQRLLFERRKPTYALADLRVSGEGLTPAELARVVQDALERIRFFR